MLSIFLGSNKLIRLERLGGSTERTLESQAHRHLNAENGFGYKLGWNSNRNGLGGI